MRRIKIIIQIILILFFFSNSYAWDCKTHSYIAKKAGLRVSEVACIPDIIRDELYDLLSPFHYHEASPDTVVTPEYIDRFSIDETVIEMHGKKYKISVPHPSGVLYWKILQIFEKMESLDKSIRDNLLAYEYHLYSIAHYVGDLSQPLHNFPYGEYPASDGKVYAIEGNFNRENHFKFDESFSYHLKNNPQIDMMIDKAIKEINIRSKEDLKREISNIANAALKIANECVKDNRLPSEEELIQQVSWSISLIKAIIKATR